MFKQGTATVDERHRRFFAESGDARQLWALDTDTGRIIYLAAEGVDDFVRRACHEQQLRCPIADCPDPRLIAKGGSVRRHHFAHKVAHTKHDNAAVYRAEATAMLASWARQYRGAHVSTHDESSLGVITIQSMFSGKIVKLAVTYDRRVDALEQFDDVGQQLIVGHTPALLLPRTEHPRLPGAWYCGEPQLVCNIIRTRGAALAVNPQLRLIATVVPRRTAERAGLAPPSDADDHPMICFVSELSTCQLEQDGLITPYLAALRAWQHNHPDYRPPVNPPSRPRRAPQDRETASPPSPAKPRPPTTRDPRQTPRTRQRPSATRHIHASHDINRVLLTSALSDEPIVRLTPSGHSICTLRVTCNPPRDGGGYTHGEVTVIALDTAAKEASRLTAGCLIAIDGHVENHPLQQRQTDSNVQELMIVAESIEVLDKAWLDRTERTLGHDDLPQ